MTRSDRFGFGLMLIGLRYQGEHYGWWLCFLFFYGGLALVSWQNAK